MPLWGREIRTLRQCTLSSCLSGAVEVEDDPSLSLPIEHPTHPFCRSGTSEGILQKHVAQCFHAGFIQGGKKTTECGTMRQLVSLEQGHERCGKGLQALIIRCQ